MALAAMFPTRQFFDNVGKPLDGGFVFTYQAGTTTPLVSYADAKYVAALPNPVVLDGAGRAQIFLLPRAYKLIVKDKGNVTVEVVDNYQGQSGELTVTQISAVYTPDYDDDIIEVIGGGPFIITLPSAVDHAGKVYTVKNLTATQITIDPDGSETIDGAADVKLTALNMSATIWSDGTHWKTQCVHP